MKGTVFDMLVFLLFGLLFAVAILVLSSFVATLGTELTDEPAFNADSKVNFTTVFSNWESGFTSVANWFILIMVLGFGLLAIFLASQIRTNPMVAVFSIFGLILVAVLGAYIANAFETFAGTSFVSAKANEFLPITFFFQNLVGIAFALGFVIIFVLARSKQGSGGMQ